MILQQLWKDADAIMTQTGRGTLPPAMYMPKRVKWIVELSHDPRLSVSFTPTPGEDKKGVERLVPFAKGTSNVSSVLLAHKPSYTFGIRLAGVGKDTADDMESSASRTILEHQHYKDLVQACAEATHNPDVARVAAFLSEWNPAKPSVQIPSEMRRDDLVTFRVDDNLPVEDTFVQAFWAAEALRRSEKSAKSSSLDMQCLVSGVEGPVEEMMPVPVKGVADKKGKIEDRQLVSINTDKTAFMSYGLMRAKNSPISRAAGERFGQALNALLASKTHHVRGGSITYVFWARSAVVRLAAFQPLYNDPQTLRDFVVAPWKGDTQWANGLPPDEKFHIFGLTANNARIVVRSVLDISIKELGKRQAEWFTRLEVCEPYGEEGKPSALWQLFAAPYRVAKDVPASVEDALVQAAFTGSRLPLSLLQTLIIRCRIGTVVNKKRILVSYERAALLKYILIQEGLPIMPELDPDNQSPAYRCGRLLAELEYIQYVSSDNKINTTLTDRYFGAASTTPRTVFPSLVRLANQGHLPKIRKKKPNFFFALQNQLAEIQASIGTSYPPTLRLIQQGEFALGYYFQRAHLYRKRDAATDAVAATADENANDLTEGDTEE